MQPHKGEDAHDDGRRRRPDVERGGELGEDRRDEAEADRNQERGDQHDLDVPGQPGAARGAADGIGPGVTAGTGGFAHGAVVLRVPGDAGCGMMRPGGVEWVKHNRNKAETHHLRQGDSCNKPAIQFLHR